VGHDDAVLRDRLVGRREQQVDAAVHPERDHRVDLSGRAAKPARRIRCAALARSQGSAAVAFQRLRLRLGSRDGATRRVRPPLRRSPRRGSSSRHSLSGHGSSPSDRAIRKVDRTTNGARIGRNRPLGLRKGRGIVALRPRARKGPQRGDVTRSSRSSVQEIAVTRAMLPDIRACIRGPSVRGRRVVAPCRLLGACSSSSRQGEYLRRHDLGPANDDRLCVGLRNPESIRRSMGGRFDHVRFPIAWWPNTARDAAGPSREAIEALRGFPLDESAENQAGAAYSVRTVSMRSIAATAQRGRRRRARATGATPSDRQATGGFDALREEECEIEDARRANASPRCRTTRSYQR
jgi:hypothetical protein